MLLSTAWQVLTGTQLIRNLGDLARFGALVFQILVPLELVVCVFLAAVSSALTVAQEKDRHTLVLLLLSDLSGAELVLGELLAGILSVLLLVVAAIPFLLLLSLLGGISLVQIGRSVAVMLMSVLACGSLGSTLAFWREKTYQTLAITTLVLIFWTAAWELAARGLGGAAWSGIPTADWAAAFQSLACHLAGRTALARWRDWHCCQLGGHHRRVLARFGRGQHLAQRRGDGTSADLELSP